MHESVRTLVVMGGSFNPPTVAHSELLRAAMAAISADLGVWLPAAHAYVHGKLKAAGQERELMGDDVRLALVRAAAREGERQTVEDYELRGAGTGYTFETLEAMARSYPGAQIHFLIGSDKLANLPRWHRADELLERFHVLVVHRGGKLPEDILRDDPYLAQRRDRFGVVTFPTGMEGVSSSAARRLLLEGDPRAGEMLTEGVLKTIRALFKDAGQMFEG